MDSGKFSVLLPALNERKNLHGLLPELHRHEAVSEILVLDDASTDGTAADWPSPEFPKIKYLRNPTRVGLGVSLLKGVLHAREERLLLRDSDFNHDVHDMDRLLRSEADLCLASRYLERIPGPGRWNDVLSTALNLSLRAGGISDWTYGYFTMRRRLLDGLPLEWIFRGRGDYAVRLYKALLTRHPGLTIEQFPTVTKARGFGVSTTSAMAEAGNYFFSCFERGPDCSDLPELLGKRVDSWYGREPAVKDRPASHSLLGFRSRSSLLQSLAKKSGPVLDIGCGDGKLTQTWLGKPAGASAAVSTPVIDGVDVSAKALQLARKTGLYRELRENAVSASDVWAHGLRGPYQTILVSELLQYLDFTTLTSLFHTLARIAAPGGELILVHPNRESHAHKARMYLGAGAEDYRFFHNSAQLTMLAEDAGWKLRSCRGARYGSKSWREEPVHRLSSGAFVHLLHFTLEKAAHLPVK